MTVFNTDEGSGGSGSESPLSVSGRADASGPTGPTGDTGDTLAYAQAIPLPIQGPLLGVNLTAYSTDGYSQPSVQAAIKTLADLGSTAITLVPTWYMPSPDANVIRPNPRKSPSDESLIQAMTWVREAGLRVIIKPHVDVINGS